MSRTVDPKAVPLGNTIRNRRRALGISGAELAKAAAIHPTSLSFMERGRQYPSIPQLDAIAKAMKTTASALLAGRVRPTNRRAA